VYQKYTTEGFIVSTRGSRESDRLYSFYTKDFGMIFAHATSVRMSKSKLRPHLNIGSFLNITLIKSKNRWKIVEVIESESRLAINSPEYVVFLKILTVLKSLIHGEEKNESLFGVVSDLYNFLLKDKDKDILEAGELLGMVGIMKSLGYGEELDILEYSGGFEEQNLKKISADKTNIVKKINKSLKATGF
jgi:recombinational DNA repair protein (RecF pathway)